MTEIIRIPFHGDDLPVIDVDGKPEVVLKPVIEGLGIDYWKQVEKLRRRSWAVTHLRGVQLPDQGQRREMVTCDIRTFLMLLATIDETRVGKDVAPKLITYQAEVADAIEAYWTQGGAINPRASADQLAGLAVRAETQMRVLRLMDGIVDGRWLEGKARELAARALGEEPDHDPAMRPLTVSDFLGDKGWGAAEVRRRAGTFGKRLKAAYVLEHGELPRIAPRFVDGAQRDVAVYTEADRPLFEDVFGRIEVAQ